MTIIRKSLRQPDTQAMSLLYRNSQAHIQSSFAYARLVIIEVQTGQYSEARYPAQWHRQARDVTRRQHV